MRRFCGVLGFAILTLAGCGGVREDEGDVPGADDAAAEDVVAEVPDATDDAGLDRGEGYDGETGGDAPIEDVARDDSTVDDGTVDDGTADETAAVDVVVDDGVTHEDAVAEVSETGDVSVDGIGTEDGTVTRDCLAGVTLTMGGDPPHAWICTVPVEDRETICPEEWHVNAVDCGPLGGMFGFYRTGDGVYELRSNDSVVSTSHGTIGAFGRTLTGLTEGVVIEVYFSDGRYFWFEFSGTSVILHGYTMIAP